MREPSRTRLNLAGADITAAKIDLRPGIPLELLADETTRQDVEEALPWFPQEATGLSVTAT